MQHWTTNTEGKPLFRYTLKNRQGMTAVFCNLGATLLKLSVPNAEGDLTSCILSHSSPEDFLQDQYFLGVTVGRYCNRIANAEFSLKGKKFSLKANEGVNQLHGGDGFATRLWDCEQRSDTQITFSLISPDGDQGFPGRLKVEATYTLTEDNHLIFAWLAESDQDTVVSLTNHAYFNLSNTADVLEHELKLNLSYYTPIDDFGIPIGHIQTVKSSVFDFQKTQSLRSTLKPLDEALTQKNGFDHNWCQALDEWTGKLKYLATLQSRKSGISMSVSSTLPGLQVYTGNYLAESGLFKTYQGICLETQFFPNAPNEASFPSPVLKAGEKMHHETHFAFGLGE